MIQRYGYLSLQVNYLNSFIQNHAYCQKIFSTSHFLAFSIRRPGESIWFYLGRGGEYQGIWLSKSAPAPEIRVQDNLLAYTRKHLSTTWLSIELDSIDRIICINSSYFGKEQKFLYFWNGADSYFIHSYSPSENTFYNVYCSWNFKSFIKFDTSPSSEILFSLFNDVGRKNLPDKALPTLENPTSVAEHQVERYLSKQTLLPENTSDKKKIQKKLYNIKKDLDKLSNFNLLKSYLDAYPQDIPTTLSFGELKLKFPEESTLEQRRNIAYTKLKVWKNHFSLMTDRLRSEESSLSSLKPIIKSEKIIMPIWKVITEIKNTPIAHNINSEAIVEFFLLKDQSITLAIGLNAQGNDLLRSKWANKTDYWFHLSNDISAHVFCKFNCSYQLDQTLFNIIGSLILHKMKSSFIGGQLVYCLARDLRSIKGKPGSVTFKNSKTVQFWQIQNLDSLLVKTNGRLKHPL